MPVARQRVVDSRQLVIDVFKDFRSELMQAYGAVAYTRKVDMSQVTELDIKVEETLKSRLGELFPEFGFQGEETGRDGNPKQFWLVDPIDGTSSFIRGLPFCTNMAALIEDDQPIAAVIYDFVNDVLYTTIKGEGAYKNQEKMSVATERLPGSLFMYSLSQHRLDDLRAVVAEIGMRCYYPVGAAGHAYMMVAEGKIDGVAVLNARTGVHDNAPGMLIVAEAGGQVTSFDGKDDIYVHEFIVGSPTVTDLVVKHKTSFLALLGR